MAKQASISDKSRMRGKWPIVFFFVMLIVIVPSFVQYLQSEGPIGGTPVGLFYGIAGLCMIIFLSFYKMRKGVYQYKIGSTQNWLQAHIYIGVISLILIFLHSGFHLKWNFSTLLFLIFMLVVCSGIVGTIIYYTVPLSISKYGRDVMSEEEITSTLQGYLKEADKSVSKASDEFKKVYEERIKPYFSYDRTNWSYLLLEEQELLGKRKKALNRLKTAIPAHEVYDLNILGSILIEKEKLAFKSTKIRLLRVWLLFHMPLAFTMFTATLIHLISILYY